MFSYIKQRYQHWTDFKLSKKESNPVIYRLIDFLEDIVIALVFVLIIRHFIIQVSLIPSISMEPTLNVGDRLFVSKYAYRFNAPNRGDIVVFNSPIKDKKHYVKRCIGLPGEVIQIKKGTVYIDGKVLLLPGVHIQRDYDFRDPIIVPKESYYVLGDNRSNSSDSRVWGFVPRENVIGKALFTFWPFSHMKSLR